MLRIALVVSLAATLQSQIPITQTYDSVVDFPAAGPVTMPHNGWHYLRYEKNFTHTADDFEELEWSPNLNTELGGPAPAVAGYFTPGYAAMFLASDQQSLGQQGDFKGLPVRAWEAPSDGTVTLTSNGPVRFEWAANPLYRGDGVRIEIWRNDLKVFERDLEHGDTNGFQIPSITFPVNVGDLIYFHADHKAVSYHDRIRFNPIVTHDPNGPGYSDNTLSRNSVTDFDATAPHLDPTHAGWEYRAYDESTQTWQAMTQTGSHWESPSQTWCRMTASYAHPLFNRQAVRLWRAPVDGIVKVRSLSTGGNPVLSKTYGNTTPVQILAYQLPANFDFVNDPLPERTLYDETITDQNESPMGLIVHCRAGDYIAIHARATAPGAGFFVSMDLDLELHPSTLPIPTSTLHASTVTLDDPAAFSWWFYEDVTIQGSLEVLEGAQLVMDHCQVALEGTQPREFSYFVSTKTATAPGILTTRNCVLGGWRVPGAGVIQSNINLIYGGTWNSRDTTVRYVYGTQLGNGARLSGLRHNVGPYPDYIHVSSSFQAGAPDTEVELEDSWYGLVIDVPCDNPTTVELDLPVVDVTTMTVGNLGTGGTNDVPGSRYHVSLTDCRPVPRWFVSAKKLPATAKTIRIDCPNFIPNLFHNGGTPSSVATASLPNSTGSAPFAPMTIHTLGVDWELTAPATVLSGWAYYGNDNNGYAPAGTVNITGGSVAELFVQDGAFSGSPSDVRFGGTPQAPGGARATTYLAHGATASLELHDVEIGSGFGNSEIKARDQGEVVIRNAAVLSGARPLTLRAETGGTFRIHDFADVDDPTKVTLVPAGSPAFEIFPGWFLADDHWAFESGIDGWLNWSNSSPYYGFLTNPSSWVSMNGALRLEFAVPGSTGPGGIFTPRITAPGSTSAATGPFAHYCENGQPRADLWLVARIRVDMANAPNPGGTGPIWGAYFYARDAQGWSNSNLYRREFELNADGNWHEYAWNIQNPGSTSTDPVVFPAGWLPLPCDMNAWQIGLADFAGTYHGNITAGDFIEVDYAAITDDPRGW